MTENGTFGFRQVSSCWCVASHDGLVSNEPSSAVAVCANWSLLSKLTVSPTSTVTDGGVNVELWIVTC